MDTSRSFSRRSFLGGGLGGGLALAGAAVLAPRPARAAAADLDFGSALGAARAIRSGQVSSVELTTRMLERIARTIRSVPSRPTSATPYGRPSRHCERPAPRWRKAGLRA